MREFKVGDQVNWRNGEFLGEVVGFKEQNGRQWIEVKFAEVHPDDPDFTSDWYGADELVHAT